MLQTCGLSWMLLSHTPKKYQSNHNQTQNTRKALMVSDEIIIKGENPKDDLNRYKQIEHQDTTERLTLT